MDVDANLSTNPAVIELTEQSETLFTVCTAYKVANPADYEVAGLELRRVKDAQKRLDELRKSMTRPLDAAKKAIMDFFRAPEDKLAKAEAGIKRAMVTYQDEQERLRREEQRRAEEAARRERERLAEQAREAERKAREKAEAERKAAEEARQAAEKAAAEGRAEEARKAAAAAAAAEARAAATEAKAAEKVEAIETRAAAVVAPIIQREAPKVAGVATREVWRFEITDPSKINDAFKMPDEQKIRKQVAALKGDAAAIIGPGVRIWCEKSIAAGAA